MTAKLSQKGIKEAKRTNKKKEVSGRVVQRLTEYLTILVELAKSEEFVNSIELSKIMDTTSAQVRKDLSTFGEFGVRGKGYEIVVLIDIIENIYKSTKLENWQIQSLQQLVDKLTKTAADNILDNIYLTIHVQDINEALQTIRINNIKKVDDEVYVCVLYKIINKFDLQSSDVKVKIHLKTHKTLCH